ncbi:adenylate/guanylate cyclase [Photobacterium gaetbulicola]|uniref:Adenylate/guanylate cyclase n=1 Tax=Photobacterium gaetbulicola TaxID=1295392 RepID=A0A0B9H4D0_9GAMM|nr:adenylate/guanylate cyclase [Photobacterium gaetbulicola]KHT63722.1 adenylate/guanylate cyclase [Photobacterium gaetbulicola]
MFSTERDNEIREIINSSLDKAEQIWTSGGYIIANESMKDAVFKSENVPSMIPGYPLVSSESPKVDEFIALVADMRNSSQHLLCSISPKRAKVTELERVFYETSALLPALAKTISYEEGNVTEYLGDGVLALFRVPKSSKEDAIYSANRAAKNIITDTRYILNDILAERYNLPPVDLGVGLSVSKAIVSLVGLPEQKQAKAFGKCVFKATKLSSGTNSVAVCENLNAIWPVAKGGGLKFSKKSFGAIDGYVINRS